jgi:HSP20 family protein
MTITRWEPIRELLGLRDTFDRFFDDSFHRAEWPTMWRGMPALDMYDVNGSVAVEFALPGVKPEEVDITVTGNTLTVKGEHKAHEEINEKDYYRREFAYGVFSRNVELPAYVDTEKIEAKFEDGLLKLVVPKVPEAQPKRIEITQ